MEPQTLILNLSGQYAEEGFLQWMQEQGKPFECVMLQDLEGTVCYCDDAAAEILREVVGKTATKLHWIDSGDYHYISRFFCERVEGGPFSLLLLDNHPDDQDPAFGGVLSCGSWVKTLRESVPDLKNVYWNCLPEPGERLYVSLDKDLLSRDISRTDWSQGEWTLPQLKSFLKEVAESGEIVGMDVCGGLCKAKGATPEDLRINYDTDADLQEFIITILK